MGTGYNDGGDLKEAVPFGLDPPLGVAEYQFPGKQAHLQ